MIDYLKKNNEEIEKLFKAPQTYHNVEELFYRLENEKHIIKRGEYKMHETPMPGAEMPKTFFGGAK